VRRRRLLYADCGTTLSTARACNLSAGNCVVLMTRTHCIRALRLDADTNTLFWVEANMVMSRHIAAASHAQIVKSV